MEEISEKKIIEQLIEKHDQYIIGYSTSVEGSQRLSVLKEKKDQLEHWVKDAAGEIYEKELEKTNKELKDIEDNMVSTDMPPAQLKARLEDHKKAKKYWVKKLEESAK